MQRLRERTRARSVVAWSARGDAPGVVAAAYEGDPPSPVAPADFERLCALPRATDLLAPGAEPALRALAERHGVAAAVAVGGGEEGDGADAVILLDGPHPVRPRVLAALDAVAARLRSPLAASHAAERLARLDRDVQRIDRLASLGALAAEIAHEVRNPLVSVKTFLQLLPERGDDPEFVSGFLDVANEELRRMERLLDLLIRHGRPDATDERCAAVAEAVDATAELVRHRALERGVELVTEIAPGLPPVALAPDALRQVLLNLVANALDASPPGGTVTVRARSVRGEVCVAVSDMGPGIPLEERTRVFEPFATSRDDRPGGLGLTITRRLVTEAGGRIEIADAEPTGAEFRIFLEAVLG